MNGNQPDTRDKAVRINQDPARYGTFAEIGAGQEVARWFFHIGHAAGTVAKTMSAYDMTFSDAIYGPADRYVSRRRLVAMLDYEFALLVERLSAKRGENTAFFVFADTVAKASASRGEDGRGWLGVRFQHAPGAAPSEVLIHVRLLDRDPLREQETLGVLGVNLMHGAFYRGDDPPGLLASLMDDLRRDALEIDTVRMTGPAFPDVDNRLLALQLVELGYTDAVLFTGQGEVVQAAEVLYGRPVLVERGSFRPITRVSTDMLERAGATFRRELDGAEPVVVLEMTLRNLSGGSCIEHEDFLARVDVLAALGHPVMVSNFDLFYRLATYLRRYTRAPIRFVLGVPSFAHVLEDAWYQDLEGGLLEGVGRLFKTGLKLYLYPSRDPLGGGITTGATLPVAAEVRGLYDWLRASGRVGDLQGVDEGYLQTFPRDVLAMIERGDPAWEALVPPQVVEPMKRHPFYCRWLARKGRNPADARHCRRPS